MNDQNPPGLSEKRKFYAALKQVFADSDYEDDPGRQESEAVLRKSIPRRRLDLARSTSDTAVVTRAQQLRSRDESEAPQQQQPHQPAIGLTRATTMPEMNDSRKMNTTESTHGKRKRGDKQQALVEPPLPPPKKLFDGLHLYFFPNNDNNAARRIRISKAVQYGAVWQKEWSDTVTHVVLDKSTTFQQLLKYLKIDMLPEGVFVVSENYPAECIGFRTILDPKQVRFVVKGFDIPTAHQHGELKTAPQPASPVLKPKPHAARQQVTPSPAKSSLSASQTEQRPEQIQHQQEADRIADSFEQTRVENREEPNEAIGQIQPQIDSNPDLDEAIIQARALHDLPLDVDDDGESVMLSSFENPPSSGDETRSKKPKVLRYQDKFSCMQANTGEDSTCANISTILILQQMADYYNQTGDEWRVRAYRKAISTLRKHPVKIYTREDAQALPNIGSRLAVKIEEIAYTNRLRRLDAALSEPRDQILSTFMKIYGVGFNVASRWVSQGYKTLSDLLAHAELTPNQRIGIAHYDDFLTRIPRTEVAEHGAVVARELAKIDPTFEVIIGGSYRRGAKNSGDIDCIITRPDTAAAHIRNVVTKQLIPILFKIGFLQASLAVTSSDDGSKWHGASCLPVSSPQPQPRLPTSAALAPMAAPSSSISGGSSTGVWRRIDLLFVPSDEMGAALIYFTGNDIFNRSLRLLASKKGMRLNQRGLYKDVIRGRNREKITEGTLLEGKDERRIFDILGVPYRPPEHRIP